MKGAIYYVAIAKVIFSHVKITCYFHTEDINFWHESSPGISLVFIIINSIHYLTGQNRGLSRLKNIWPVIMTSALLSTILSPGFTSAMQGVATKSGMCKDCVIIKTMPVCETKTWRRTPALKKVKSLSWSSCWRNIGVLGRVGWVVVAKTYIE